MNNQLPTYKKFPKLYKYMTINRDINYIDPIFSHKYNVNNKVNEKVNENVNIIEYPHNLAFTNQSWYEEGTSDFIYYPYNYKFGVPNVKWKDNYGGFLN